MQCGVCKGFVVEQVLFCIFIIHSGSKCLISEFAGDTKLSGAVAVLEGPGEVGSGEHH